VDQVAALLHEDETARLLIDPGFMRDCRKTKENIRGIVHLIRGCRETVSESALTGRPVVWFH
jgi:hypothetical protein